MPLNVWLSTGQTSPETDVPDKPQNIHDRNLVGLAGDSDW